MNYRQINDDLNNHLPDLLLYLAVEGYLKYSNGYESLNFLSDQFSKEEKKSSDDLIIWKEEGEIDMDFIDQYFLDNNYTEEYLDHQELDFSEMSCA